MSAPELRPYETTYIVVPELDDADYKAIVSKFNDIITQNGGKITHQELWGVRKLAYTIQRRSSGYYVYTEMLAPSPLVHILEREYGYDERIIRFLTVAPDKHAVAFAEKRRAKLKA